MSDREQNAEDNLPEDLKKRKPSKPFPNDCCGMGCMKCVNDIYAEDLEIWNNECYEYLNKKQTDERSQNFQGTVISPNEYTEFMLEDIVPETHNSKIYRFKIHEQRNLGLTLGQHLILRGEVQGETISRQYTPISSTMAEGFFDILIKLYADGRMSKYIATWYTGIKISWRGPFGHFEYVPNSVQKMVLLAGGTGIAPMIQIISRVVENKDDDTFVHLMYACKTVKDVLLKTLLNNFKRYWNFTVSYYLSQETEDEKPYGEEIHYGRINKCTLLSKLFTAVNCKVLICGPRSFNDNMKTYLYEIGFSDKQYFVF